MPYNKKYGKGVPKGYTHNWTYRGKWHEKKIAPGKWRIKFRATKRTRAGRGGPKPGFKILWGFKNVKQRAIKTGKGKYQTELTGIKYVKKAGHKKNYYKKKYRKY